MVAASFLDFGGGARASGKLSLARKDSGFQFFCLLFLLVLTGEAGAEISWEL